jgi:hypothetical protein
LTPVDVNESAEIERAVAEFARIPNGGLVVTGSAQALTHRNLIIATAATFRNAPETGPTFKAPVPTLLCKDPSESVFGGMVRTL